jgi:hypothetical protein
VVDEFSARGVTTRILEHLERRRPALVASDDAVRAEIDTAMVPVRQAFAELELPAGYIDALAEELRATLPALWRPGAERFTRLEQGGFGLWRGGDVVARLTFVSVGFFLGVAILRVPFIPIWEKWFPFALALGAWWLPDLQAGFHKRRYARALGEIVAALERAQPALDQRITLAELSPPEVKT